MAKRDAAPSRLLMPGQLRREISECARAAYPAEACGLLIGAGSADVIVTAMAPARNTAEDPLKHFAIDPQLQFDVLRSLRGSGKRVVGHFHSHPDGPARPSRHDLAMAYDPEAVWVIVSVDAQGQGEMKAFRCPGQAEGFVEIPLAEHG